MATSFLRALLFFIVAILRLSFAYNHITRKQLVENNNGDEKIPVYSEDEEPLFLRPKHLNAGELATVVRRDNGESVDPGTFFIGLPPKLTELFQTFVQESGILQIAQELLYENPVKLGENRLYRLKDGTTWGARTSNNWVDSGDMTWIDPADEWTYELIMDIYRKGGFDEVLDTLGERHGCEGLWIDGTSFIVVSHFEGYNIHTDLDGMEGKVFNILFPLVIPEAGGKLEVADRETREEGMGANFRLNQGVLVGGESPHGTGNVDYRATREFRLAVAVYMDDLNEENVEEFDDDTASFPPAGDPEYLLTQAARHWGGTSPHASLATDKGRRPYPVEDDDPVNCPIWAEEGWCLKEMETRNACVKSCEVYLEDSVYYEKLGKLLGWPTETE